jgi:hypothetical protein
VVEDILNRAVIGEAIEQCSDGLFGLHSRAV